MDAKFETLLNEYKNDNDLINYFDKIIERINKHKQFVKDCNNYVNSMSTNVKNELLDVVDQINVEYCDGREIFFIKNVKFGKNKDGFYFGDMIKITNSCNNIIFNVQILKNFYKILKLKYVTIYIFLEFVSVIVKIQIALDLEFYKAELTQEKYEKTKKKVKVVVSGFNNLLKYKNQTTDIRYEY